MRVIPSFLAAAALAVAAPAMAAFTVNIGAPVTGIPTNNDFDDNLANAGLYTFTAAGASLSISSKAIVTFEYMGSESGNLDTFKVGASSFDEYNKGWGAVPMFSVTQLKGAITNWLFTSAGGAQNVGIGTPEFGIFLPRGLQPGGTYTSDVLYLGFDDQITGDDDNHDDFIVRVSIDATGDPGSVPEPASWAMLIAGFGLVGAAQRRRKLVVSA
jgi:hypothetical protein